MKAKFISLLLALTVSAGTVVAERVQIGDLYYNLNTENLTAEVTYQNFIANNYNLTSVEIPSSVTYNSRTYSVTSIGATVFYNCAELTSITIPGSVKSIGNMAFMSCSSLTSITIPEGVTSIGMAAFSYCTALTSFTISGTVTSVGDGVFANCSNLTSWVYNEHVFAFMPRTYSGDYSVPEGIESIAGSAFYDCTALTSVTIPGSVRSIGLSAFNGCSSLSSVICKSSTPPALGNLVFENTPSSMQIGVRCEALDEYKSQWSDFSSQMYILPAAVKTVSADTVRGSVTVLQSTCDSLIAATAKHGYRFTQWTDGNTDNPRLIDPLQEVTYIAEFGLDTFAVVVKANNPDWGTTSADTAVLYQDRITIAATPNYGYHFAQWEDGDTLNPRLVTVMGDTTYTAFFAKNTYTIYDRTDTVQGAISGAKEALYLDEVQLTAVPKYGYHFTQWTDGVTDNPRTIVLAGDTAFAAEFTVDRSGTCGDDNRMAWTYDAETWTLTISGKGKLNSYYTFGVEAPSEARRLNIEEGMATIGAHAFEGASHLLYLYFGSTLEAIGDSAFLGCRRVKEMTCLAGELTPDVGTDALTSISSLATLNVPNEYLLDYRIDPNWNRFQLKGIGATPATVTGDEPQVQPTDSTVTITWPTIAGADSYTIEVTKNGVVICRLTFSATGQLIGITFAPSRSGEAHAPAATMTADGLQFTLTGLESDATYSYTIDAKSGDAILATYSGEFTTTDPSAVVTAVEPTTANPASLTAQKVILNGQLYILFGDKTYRIDGTKVR